MKTTNFFSEAFGNSPTIRILSYLLEGRELDYSLTDIAENSNVGWTTLHRVWSDLIKWSFVKQTRVIGRAKLFKINMESQIIKELAKLYDKVLLQYTNNLLEKKIIAKEI